MSDFTALVANFMSENIKAVRTLKQLGDTHELYILNGNDSCFIEWAIQNLKT